MAVATVARELTTGIRKKKKKSTMKKKYSRRAVASSMSQNPYQKANAKALQRHRRQQLRKLERKGGY